MLLASVVFLMMLFVLFLAVGAYLAACWVVRNAPNSSVSKFLRQVPYFDSLATAEDRQRHETIRQLRQDTAPVQSADQKRLSFRDARPPDDSIVVTMPQTGAEITFRVAGTMNMVELWQQDDSSRDKPWTRTGNNFIFHVLKGKQNAWIFEAPGVLALLTEIDAADEATIQQFVGKARAFGQSHQTASDIAVEWKGGQYYLFDIGRLGIFAANGDVPWKAASEDYGDRPWPDLHQVKFLFAGPHGGKDAPKKPLDDFLAVITPVSGTGGRVLRGQLINEQFLEDVREEA